MKIDFEYLKKDENYIFLMGELKILEIERDKLKEEYNKRKDVYEEIERIHSRIPEIIKGINNIISNIENNYPRGKKLKELIDKKNRLKGELSKLRERLPILEKIKDSYDCEISITERNYFGLCAQCIMKEIEIQDYVRKILSKNVKTKVHTKEENN